MKPVLCYIFDAFNYCADARFDFARLDGCLQQVEIPFLAAAELFLAIYENHPVLLRERKRIFYASISAPHNHDSFIVKCFRIIKLIFHIRKIFTRNTQLADFALKPDSKHYKFGLQYRSGKQADLE